MTDIHMDSLHSDIRNHSELFSDEAGRQVIVLFEARGMRIADQHHISLREVYQNALMLEVVPLRYLRNQASLTTSDQLKLCRSCIAIVGVGGLGGYAADLLARIGIGALILIDPDTYTESNLNRQRFALNQTLYAAKVAAAADLIKSINPAVEVFAHREQLSRENGARLLEGAKVAVDALDNIPDRLLLQDLCEALKIHMVHGAIAGFEGQVLTIIPGSMGLKKLYEDGQSQTPAPDSVLGVPAITPMMVGGLQVMEVLKIILDRGHPFADTMIYLDLESAQFEKFRFGPLT